MLQLFKTRFEQGKRTLEFPGAQSLPSLFRGRPDILPGLCREGCEACADACPTDAISLNPLTLDLGRCLFCTACTDACPEGAIVYRSEFAQSFRSREAMVQDGGEAKLAGALDEKMRKLFGRSLRLRHVAAGDCSGCAAELTALGNVVFDLGRFGIQFVASPRHADGIVVSGPVTANMREALRLAYEATPAPRIVIAVGACAISGGPFRDSPAQANGVPPEVPVDLFVAGCPPHPLTLLDGMLRLLGRIEAGR
ncbi:MAG: NADH-quinone oxidoreductase subunit NuoB [Myxococcales bacterium]